MTAVTAESPAGGRPGTHRGEPFFFWLALIVTVVVFSGFGVASWVFREELDRFSVPILLHGVFSAAWFLLLLTQIRLVGRGKLALHRKLGLASLVIAAVIVLGGPVMTIDLYQDSVASAEFDASDPEDLASAAGLVGATLLQWVLFTVTYTLGLLNQHRPVHHKRFMVGTAIQVMPAALSRWLAVFGLPEPLVLPIVRWAELEGRVNVLRRIQSGHRFGPATMSCLPSRLMSPWLMPSQ